MAFNPNLVTLWHIIEQALRQRALWKETNHNKAKSTLYPLSFQLNISPSSSSSFLFIPSLLSPSSPGVFTGLDKRLQGWHCVQPQPGEVTTSTLSFVTLCNNHKRCCKHFPHEAGQDDEVMKCELDLSVDLIMTNLIKLTNSEILELSWDELSKAELIHHNQNLIWSFDWLIIVSCI